MGRGNHELGREEIAERFFQRAVAMSIEVLGPNHPLVANSLIDLSTVFSAEERYSEAEAVLSYLIDYLNRTLEDDDPTGILWALFYIAENMDDAYLSALIEALPAPAFAESSASKPGWVTTGTPRAAQASCTQETCSTRSSGIGRRCAL